VFTNKVIININVFRMDIKDKVFSKAQNKLIVNENSYGRVYKNTKLRREFLKLDYLVSCLSKGHIFGLYS